MTSAKTDWGQILAWYDDLVALNDNPERDEPAALLNRAVAVGHIDGARAGLAETERVRATLGDRDQCHAVRYPHDLGGELAAAAEGTRPRRSERPSSPKERPLGPPCRPRRARFERNR
jgi:predicted RNA polymerase sigma factor